MSLTLGQTHLWRHGHFTDICRYEVGYVLVKLVHEKAAFNFKVYIHASTCHHMPDALTAVRSIIALSYLSSDSEVVVPIGANNLALEEDADGWLRGAVWTLVTENTLWAYPP